MTSFRLCNSLFETVRTPVRLSVAILSVALIGILVQSRVEILKAEELPLASSGPKSEEDKQTENGNNPDSEGGKKPPAQEHSANDQKGGINVEINPITGVGTVSAVDYQALAGAQRWHLYFRQNFTTVGAYLGIFMGSVLDQLGNQPPEWGQGISGYGERLVSRFGSGIVQGTIQASACALVKQDPRYIRSGSERPWPRAVHALLYSVLTYNNEGKPRLAVATVGSYYSSSMIATTWLPTRYSPLGDGVRDGNRQVILASLSNLVQEFWPEIRKIMGRK